MTAGALTVGSFLAAAEHRLATTGGLTATAAFGVAEDGSQDQISILAREPGKPPRTVLEKRLPQGIAPEDAARRLLIRANGLGLLDPEQAAFAIDIFFPIDLVSA